jgi:hypothetical protein
VKQNALIADYRVVEKVSVPESPAKTRATFVIEGGTPGAHRQS